MANKRNNAYTVMIVPNPSSKIFRFTISRRAIQWAVGVGSVLAVAALFVTVQYFVSLHRLSELRDLREENKVQKVQLQTFAQTVSDLKKQMARLREFNMKLRVIAGLDEAEEEPSGVAMGGTEGPDVDELVNSVGVSENVLSRAIEQELSNLQQLATQQEISFQELEDVLRSNQVRWAATPSIWPVRGWLASGFGKRISPFTGVLTMHNGVDIATRMGAPIVAPADGVVTYVGYHNGLGKMIKINHGYGVETLYGHLSKYDTKRGERVKRGDVIGYVGSTGLSTGPHLHYEVMVNRVPVNPLRYILN